MSAADILVVADVQLDHVAETTLEVLTAARSLANQTGGQVLALLLAGDGGPDPAPLGSADRILTLDHPLLAHFAPTPYLAAIEHVAKIENPRAVLFGSTSVGLDLAPLLAARIGAPVVTGCRRVDAHDDTLQVEASFCGGKMIADLRIERSPAVLNLLPGSHRAATPAGTARVETITDAVPIEPGPVQFEQMIPPAAGDVDITQQDILVGVGRGIQQEDNLAVAEDLASALGGALCASRPIVDQGWLPTTRQVGKSGMMVKPKCYLALGISGAPEHVEGMQNSDLIIAVNTDPEAPIFEIAHYGVVGDLLDIVPALAETLAKN